LILRKGSSKIKKIPESIKAEKEVEKNLTVAYDFVKIDSIKEKVLETQLVTTS
jgi:hypothetical protein